MDLTSPIRLANGVAVPRLACATSLAFPFLPPPGHIQGQRRGGEGGSQSSAGSWVQAHRHGVDIQERGGDRGGHQGERHGEGRGVHHLQGLALRAWVPAGTCSVCCIIGTPADRLSGDFLLCWFPYHNRASERNAEVRLESWRALEQLHREGKCRTIGVSNFTAAHLDHLMTNSATPPSVNQVEVHPLLTQRALRAHCAERGICVAAYSPLGCGQLLQHPTVLQVAQKVSQSTAQVLLRWSLQHGMVTIPKSVNPNRIRENANIFSFALDKENMEALDALDEDHHFCWSPIGIA
ncbi:hypothetical protein CLOM_g23666 [Closterium sp. NIES-68]|nr:hypothetical protein CLOM_g23666 [Closterium sp. NIES-68]GJP86887.1 hypothetical protein CLOP_g16860 [Closterium sp. NIES-67]